MRAALTTWSRFGLLTLMFMTLAVVIVRVGQSQTAPPNQPVLYGSRSQGGIGEITRVRFRP